MNIKRLLLTATAVLALTTASAHAAYVTDYGANGQDTVSDQSAFEAAFESSNGVVYVSDGTYYVQTLNVPAGMHLVAAAGSNPVIKPLAGYEDWFVTPRSDSIIDGITFIDELGATHGIVVCGTNVRINNCTVDGFDSYGIYGDHADGLTVSGTTVRNSNSGIHTIFAVDVTVENCYVEDITQHGIWFWNIDQNTGAKYGGNLIYRYNVVKNAVSGIWGNGASNVQIYGNKVDNFGDVGLDFEACDDSVIRDNVVSRCYHGGIALFHGCNNIEIYNNIVYNNHTRNDASGGGIKLMPEDPNVSYDQGYNNVKIYNNTVYSIPDGRTRKGINILQSYKTDRNIYLNDNIVFGNGQDVYVNGEESDYTDFTVRCSTSGITIVPNEDNVNIEPYKKVVSVEDGSTTATIKGRGMGAYRVDVTFDSSPNSYATLTVDSGDTELISTRLSRAEHSNNVYSVYFDSSSSDYLTIKINGLSSGSVESIALYKADINLIEVLREDDGVLEVMNNAYSPMDFGIIMKRPQMKIVEGWLTIYQPSLESGEIREISVPKK